MLDKINTKLYVGIWSWALVDIWFCDDKEDILRFLESDPVTFVASWRPSLDTASSAFFSLWLCFVYWLVHWSQLLLPAGLLVWLPVWKLFLELWHWFITVRFCSRPWLSPGCSHSCSVAGRFLWLHGHFVWERATKMVAERRWASAWPTQSFFLKVFFSTFRHNVFCILLIFKFINNNYFDCLHFSLTITFSNLS